MRRWKEKKNYDKKVQDVGRCRCQMKKKKIIEHKKYFFFSSLLLICKCDGNRLKKIAMYDECRF